MKARLPAALLAVAAFSCGSKGAISLTVTIEQPSLAVGMASALAVGLSGSFVVHLELGQVSPDSTDVSISQGAYSLVRAADQSTLLVLKTVAATTAVHLAPGGQADVTMTVSDGSSASAQMITAAQATDLCLAGPVQIVGSISDSASGGPNRAVSSTFALNCAR